jgi:Tfp pilus assembly protein PilF
MNTDEAIELAAKHHQEGNLQQAENICREILKAQPDNADAMNLLTEIYFQLKPNDAITNYNMGNLFREKGQYDEAIACYQKAIQLVPISAETYYNYGKTLMQKGAPDGAIVWFQRASELNLKVSFELYFNLGNIFRYKGKFTEAANHYEKAMQFDDPQNFVSFYGFCYALFFAGNLKKALKEFQTRWKYSCSSRYKNLSRPLWDGSDIEGRTILIQSGGFGDQIWFIRYIPLLAKNGIKVIFECKKELLSLLQDYEGIKQIVLSDEPLTGLEYDVHLPIYMLPLAFNATPENIPVKVPYLTADPLLVKKWANKVKKFKHDNTKLKVGLVWSSTEQFKSCPLELFSPLAQFDEVTFYSLQKGVGAEQAKNPPKGMKLIDLTNEIYDFSDTAALIENLDLIISIDTAVAHLAGALGKPVWVLARHYLLFLYFVIGENSPWYPTMRCFKSSSGKWEEVIDRILIELQKKISEKN